MQPYKDLIQLKRTLVRPVRFVYSPIRPNPFSAKGEELVDSLINCAPVFHSRLNEVIGLEIQRQIMNETFQEGQLAWKEATSQIQPSERSTTWFSVNRKFNSLAPLFYYRSKVPRLTTKGGTFHGMHKPHKLTIAKRLSEMFPITFTDIDMGACHTRIALCLSGNNPRSLLFKSLHESNFWQSRINLYEPKLRPFGLSKASLKGLLKVPLYTALNGGNPSSPVNLGRNLENSVPHYVMEYLKDGHPDPTQSPLAHSLKEIYDNDALLAEVKDLCTKCYLTPLKTRPKEVFVYTMDQTNPYKTDSPHKGISRVFQGFEVVFLACLVSSLLEQGFQPVSLDHDGTFCWILNTQFDIQNKDHILETIRQDFQEVPEFFLNGNVPLEYKYIVQNGKIHES